MEERFDGAEKKKIEKEAREIERTETIYSSGASINPTTMPVLHFSVFFFLFYALRESTLLVLCFILSTYHNERVHLTENPGGGG